MSRQRLLQAVEEWTQRGYSFIPDPVQNLPESVRNDYLAPVLSHIYGLRSGALDLHVHYQVIGQLGGHLDCCLVLQGCGARQSLWDIWLSGDGVHVPVLVEEPDADRNQTGQMDMQCPVTVLVTESIEQVKAVEVRLMAPVGGLAPLNDRNSLVAHVSSRDIPLLTKSCSLLVLPIDIRDVPDFLSDDGVHDVRALGRGVECTCKVIQTRPKIVQNVPNDERPSGVRTFCELHNPFALVLALDNFASSVGVAVPKLPNLSIELIEVFFSPAEFSSEGGNDEFAHCPSMGASA